MPVSLPEIARVVLAAIVLLLPGVPLAALLVRPPRPRTAFLVISGLVGLAGVALTFWLAARFHASLAGALAAWGGVGVAALVALRFVPRPAATAAEPGPLVELAGPGSTWLARLLLVAALLALPFGTYTSGGADTWEYFNRAAHILRTGQLVAGSPYGPDLHAPYDPTFYALLAAVARLSGVAVASVGSIVTVVATPLELGAVVLAVAWIAGRFSAGLWGGLVYLLVYGPFFLARNSIHHQMLGDALFLVAWGAVFRHRRAGDPRLLVLAAVTAAASATLHHFLIVQCAVAVGLTGLVFLWRDHRAGRPVRPAIVEVLSVALGLLPIVLVVATTHLDAVDPKAMDDFFRDVYAPLLRIGPLYIPEPFTWYFRRFWHPLPALLLVIWAWPRAKEDARLAALVALLLAPILVVLNPLVFPLAAKLTGLQVATRILNLTLFPSVALLGWVLAEWWSGRMAADARPARTAGLLAAASILVIAPQTLIRLQGDYFPGARARELSESPVAWRAALARLAAEARPGDVVMADPITSYSIPTFAPLSIVAHQRADFAFQTPDHADRRRWQAMVTDPFAAPDSTMLAIERTGARWILLNRRFVNPLAFDKLEMIRRTVPGLKRAFEVDGVAAWSYDPTQRGTTPTASAVLEQLLIPPVMFATFLEPGTGVRFDPRYGIGGVLGPDQAGLGDTLYVTVYYEWRPGPPGPNWYVKLMREAAYGSSARWFGRQWRGAILGQADAILFPRALAYADFRARQLPPGTVMADQFNVLVPKEAVTGRYALYVAPGGFPTESNPGIKLGTVEIVKRRIDQESAALDAPADDGGHRASRGEQPPRELPGNAARHHDAVVEHEGHEQRGEGTAEQAPVESIQS